MGHHPRPQKPQNASPLTASNDFEMTRQSTHSSRWMGHALVVVILLLAATQVFTRELNSFDEGAIVHIAERLANGEVLYRDVDTGLMPGVYYLHALLFRVFGPSLLVGRIASMIVFALTG